MILMCLFTNMSISMKVKAITLTSLVPSHFTNMYPMALMCLSPLSAAPIASFPQVLVSSCCPPVPNPILESHLLQSILLSPMIPIRALPKDRSPLAVLNPSFSQLVCSEACKPISFFHVCRPSEVLRYCPSAISECRQFACLLMKMNLICWPIFIPRQILEKDVFQ